MAASVHTGLRRQARPYAPTYTAVTLFRKPLCRVLVVPLVVSEALAAITPAMPPP